MLSPDLPGHQNGLTCPQNCHMGNTVADMHAAPTFAMEWHFTMSLGLRVK
jgi:hypothetical protein